MVAPLTLALVGGTGLTELDDSLESIAIDTPYAGFQPGRINHVRRAAGMNQQCRFGEFLHQSAGAAGMIEVNVGDDDVAHRFPAPSSLFQHLHQSVHAGVRSGLDDRDFDT